MFDLRRFTVLTCAPDALSVPCPPTGDAEVAPIGPADLAAIEAVRPGYGARAATYLAEGHKGLALRAEGQVASLAWVVRNGTARRMWVDYYPLAPGRIWFHAAWTHPAFRGRGYHGALIHHRRALVRATWGEAWCESNVAPGVEQSIRNYVRQGFDPAGALWVLGVRGRTVAWRTA